VTSSNPDLAHIAQIVASVVRNIRLRRVLHDIDPDPPLNFWRLMYGNAFDMAVVDWCKLFGSDNPGQQPVHWKNVVSNTDQPSFRVGLLAAVEMTEAQWLEYWRELKRYRDNHAAHFNAGYLLPNAGGRVPTFPDLIPALEATYCYYNWLLAELNANAGSHHFPNDIRYYSDSFAKQAAAAANKAIASTAAMKELVL